MKIGIMQPYFFPYIGYWQLMAAVDTYVVYDDVNYIKNGWINRNRILINGKPSYFNLQLIDASPNKKINEIRINKNEVFAKKNIRSLEMAYKKAPYFEKAFPVIKKILESDEDRLEYYIFTSFKIINEYLGINTNLVMSSSIEKNNDLKGQDKVIEICKVLKCDEYYNAIGGTELYDKDIFKSNGIDLHFLKTRDIQYKQFTDEFVPYLSIIDVLMFNSKEDVLKMFKEFDLR